MEIGRAGGQEFLAPNPHLRFAFGQKLAQQGPEGLQQSGVRKAALNLIEFAGDEVTVLASNRFIDFLDEGGLADARLTGDQHHFARAGAHPITRRQQDGDFVLAPVEFLWNLKPVGDIALAQGHQPDLPLHLQLPEGDLQIRLKAVGRLVTVLGIFGHQL